MQLPDKAPLVENVVITSADELSELVKEALSQGKGAFLKIFAKDKNGKYYITVLFDSSKVLAVECLVVDNKQTLIGDEALKLLKSLLGRPMVVDVYSLDEIEMKLSIAENLDVYSETPKIPLNELFSFELLQPPKVEVSKPQVAQEKSKGIPATEEKPAPTTSKPAPQPVPKPSGGKPEVIVNFTGGSIPEEAFKKYAENIIKEAGRIRGISVNRVEFDANVGEGVVYINVRVYGTSESDDRRQLEVAEKRIFHIVSKHAPIILREAEYKPILRDISVVLNGREVKPQQIVDTDKKKEGNVTPDGRIKLAVLEDVWPYFSNFARTVIKELETAGIKVTRAYFDIKGRREFEINLAIAVESEFDRATTERTIRTILTRHARELGRSIGRYISVHSVDVELIERTTTVKPSIPTVTSGKAAEILAKKELLEKEVERLLKEAGIEELAPLTEEKRREAEETLLKSRIEPAIETLKNRIHAELKLIPRVTFKWLKLNHEIQGSTVYVNIEASFVKESVGGLFGAYSGVSDERIKKDITETINRIIQDISREYGVAIRPKKISIILR
ncbi:SPOR domain-containing protein [Thermococcus sp.]